LLILDSRSIIALSGDLSNACASTKRRFQQRWPLRSLQSADIVGLKDVRLLPVWGVHLR
jgi:hypothetical protein